MRAEFKPRRESRGPCAAPNCDRGAIIATDLGQCCNKHYQAVRRYGTFEPPASKPSREVICTKCGKAFDRGYAISAARAKNSQFCSRACRAKPARVRAPRPLPPPSAYPDSAGYILVHDRSHPLMQNGERVRQHRVVMYDHHGFGPYTCHWCGAALEWATMHIDHINDDKADNRIENLAPACPLCNLGRGQHKAIATQRANGKLLTYQGKTQCVSEWAAVVGISRTAIEWRLARGWSVERALTKPRGKTGPQSRRHG